MDSDQVFDHRKFDSGALQGGTAPTDTPRTNARCKKIRHEALGLGYVADELQHWAEDLERELAAARAEADELARRVAAAIDCGSAEPFKREFIDPIIARVRAEMDKEKGNG